MRDGLERCHEAGSLMESVRCRRVRRRSQGDANHATGCLILRRSWGASFRQGKYCSWALYRRVGRKSTVEWWVLSEREREDMDKMPTLRWENENGCFGMKSLFAGLACRS